MDEVVFGIINGAAGKSTFVDTLAIFFAGYLPYLLVIMSLIFILTLEGFREKVFTFIFVALGLILSRGLITPIIRFFYDRERPFEVLNFNPLVSASPGDSFPSGHSAFFFALAFLIFYFSRKWGYWLMVFAMINSIARVFVGIHWPSDVLAGIAVAAISFFLVQKLFQKKQHAES